MRAPGRRSIRELVPDRHGVPDLARAREFMGWQLARSIADIILELTDHVRRTGRSWDGCGAALPQRSQRTCGRAMPEAGSRAEAAEEAEEAAHQARWRARLTVRRLPATGETSMVSSEPRN